jgi:DNA-binding CsgD family transcriptional regulator
MWQEEGLVFTDSPTEQVKVLEELLEILFFRRPVPSGIWINILRIGRSARSLFLPQVHSFFDAIWDFFDKAWREACERARKIEEETKSRYAPGTPDGDLVAFLFGDYFFEGGRDSIEVRNEVVFRIARRMPPKFRSPRAQRELRNKARERSRPPHVLLQDEILPPALLEAAARGSTPQRIRLGRKCVKDVDGNVPEVRPWHVLDGVRYWDWLRQEAMRIAAHRVLDKPYPDLPEDALEAKPSAQSDRPVLLPPEAILAHDTGRKLPFVDPEIGRCKGVPLPIGPDDESIARGAALRKLLEAEISPRERELLLLSEGDPSTDDLAGLLGVAPATVHVMRTRLRKKAMKILAAL